MTSVRLESNVIGCISLQLLPDLSLQHTVPYLRYFMLSGLEKWFVINLLTIVNPAIGISLM
jgi:hypothetical protein